MAVTWNLVDSLLTPAACLRRLCSLSLCTCSQLLPINERLSIMPHGDSCMQPGRHCRSSCSLAAPSKHGRLHVCCSMLTSSFSSVRILLFGSHAAKQGKLSGPSHCKRYARWLRTAACGCLAQAKLLYTPKLQSSVGVDPSTKTLVCSATYCMSEMKVDPTRFEFDWLQLAGHPTHDDILPVTATTNPLPDAAGCCRYSGSITKSR